jgi:hypothetical protein
MRRSSTAGKAMLATALLLSTWRQTQNLRDQVAIPGQRAGLTAVSTILASSSELSLADVMVRLVDRCVVVCHLTTTLTKMSRGLKCSLRFFPDGRTLRPTGMGVVAGYSGDRLDNVFGFLGDLGLLEADGVSLSLSTRGESVLAELGGADDA